MPYKYSAFQIHLDCHSASKENQHYNMCGEKKAAIAAWQSRFDSGNKNQIFELY